MPVVGPVKDQGGCGSCWAFSATFAAEAAYALEKNKTVVLSEQQLVDCAGSYGNSGCNGGWEASALNYILHVGVVSSNYYPYMAILQECKSNVIKRRTKHYIKSWTFVARGPKAHIEALQSRPLTGSFYVERTFQSYGGGIYTISECNLEANHALGIVGYDISNPAEPYFILRNSWGTYWGDQGYAKMSIHEDDGVCGF